jgi:hypothetical protein
MPVTTRKAKPQTKSYIEDRVDSSDEDGPNFDKVFGYADKGAESDEPDFRKKAKSKRKKSLAKTIGKKSNDKKRKPTQEQTLPDMSDDEDRRAGDTPDLEEYPIHFDDSIESLHSSKAVKKDSKKRILADEESVTLPEVLQINIDASSSNGKATIMLNLADIISRSQASERVNGKTLRIADTESTGSSIVIKDEEETLVEPDEPQHRSKRAKLLHDAKAEKAKARLKRMGFTDLPYELRVGIYRHVLVRRSALHFTSKENFSRSSQFLRTCKLVHEEGREIMYGENAFHFMRSSQTRGSYFEAEWREIGWKDIRRFLEDIGPVNISMLKYVSFQLTDAPPSVTPYLEEEQRRCTNDPVLHRVFRLIGSHATLNKLAMGFGVRRNIDSSDYIFLKSLASIKCHNFKQSERWWNVRRMGFGIMDRLQKVMVIKEEVNDDVDLSKKKVLEPDMAMI